jgi:predicted phosphodiesterase
MSIKIFHTADVHLGMQFKNGRYSEEIRTNLIDARFKTLHRMIDEANNRSCELFVIAGDLFDSLRVSDKIINRAAEIISGFKGEFVFVLPGNHDFIDSAEDNLWAKFSAKAKGHVIVCDREESHAYQIGEQSFSVFPGPCRSKHSAENAIGWIAKTAKQEAVINIGIAHGAVAGLSPDNEDKYFLMKESELADAQMDLWLLGHTHVYYPTKPDLQKPMFFMPATPEPDGFDCKHRGHAWYIEVGDDKAIQYEQLNTGKYQYYDITGELSSEADINTIIARWNKPENKNVLMRLTLSGRLPQEVVSELPNFEARLRGLFTFLQVDRDQVRLQIDEAFIDRHYTNGSLPHILLKNIAAKTDDPSVLTIAYDLLEGARQ